MRATQVAATSKIQPSTGGTMGYKRTAFVSEIDNMDVNEGGKCV